MTPQWGAAVNEVFADFMMELGARDRDVYYVVSDGNIAGMQEFEKSYPDRFVNVGIAEQNAVSMAFGICSTGKRVFLWNNVCFLLYRPFDQIRIDAAFTRAKIRLIGTSAGYTRGPDIAQASVEDVAVMRALPNMTVVCPGDLREMQALLPQIDEIDGPVYMRLPKDRSALPVIHSADAQVTLGRAIEIFTGNDAVVICTGHALEEAHTWVSGWRQDGIDVGLISMHTIKPFDQEAIARLVRSSLPVVTIEEHSTIGGLGSAVAEAIAESGHGVPFLRVGVPDRHPHVAGDPHVVKKHMGMPGPEEVLAWIQRS
ncbi:transketolase family protein [Nonomuraea wenchangensis]|uniref:transketolase family protein n=1 Tax=Nonomuraea wenchangensis TaxID=568860 RepID=UPI0037897D98